MDNNFSSATRKAQDAAARALVASEMRNIPMMIRETKALRRYHEEARRHLDEASPEDKEDFRDLDMRIDIAEAILGVIAAIEGVEVDDV